MANYPPLIHLDEDTELRLRTYIEEELLNYYAEADNHVQDLLRWQRDYWAQPRAETPKFPYNQGSSNIVIPLTAIAIEAIHARTMTTMFGMPQFVSATAVSGDWEPVEKAVERFMDYELLNQVRIRDSIESVYLELEKFGTGVAKPSYEKVVKKAKRQLDDGSTEPFYVTVKDGATVDAVSDSRFLMRHHFLDPQTAPWCGEEHRHTPYELRSYELAGMFYEDTIIGEESKLYRWINRSELGTSGDETGIKFIRQQEELENTKPHFPDHIDWVELWMAFDVDGDGIDEEIVVYYHRESQEFLGIRYNWHADLHRPYRIGVYQKVEHRWRGIGLCKMNEHFQKEVTVQHRQRIDNATIANLKMFKVSKLSGYGPNEPIFPGKMWFLDDMDHIDQLPIGEIYPSSYQNEQATLIFSQQRTGVNEVTLGMPQVGTPGTATADLARIQEGNRKFDYFLHNIKSLTTDVVADVGALVQQFGPRNLRYFETAENGQLVAQFFQMPDVYIRDGLLITLRSTGQQFNKVLDRQNWQQIAAMLQQYYNSLMILAQQSGNPQLMQTILFKGMAAATEAMRQIFETFDVRNIDRMIVREIEGMVRSGLEQSQTNPGGSQGTEGLSEEQALAQLTQAFSFAGGNGNGGANRIQGLL